MSLRTYKTKHCNINGVQFGDKKQGLCSTTGRDHWASRAIQTSATGTPETRNLVFCINMLGGVGAGRSQFSNGNNYAHPRGALHCQPHAYDKR